MLSRLSITRGSYLSVSQCSATPTWISRSKMLKIFTIHTNTQSHTHFCSKHLHPSWRRRKEWAFGGRGGGSTSNDVPSFVFPSWGFVTFERSPRLDFLFKEHWNCVCDEMGTYLRNGMHSKCLANICICSRCTQEGLCLMWVWCVCLKWLLVEHTHTDWGKLSPAHIGELELTVYWTHDSVLFLLGATSFAFDWVRMFAECNLMLGYAGAVCDDGCSLSKGDDSGLFRGKYFALVSLYQ